MASYAQGRSLMLSRIAAVLVLASLSLAARAQGGGCVFIPDKHHPQDRILRCGGDLTVRPAAGTAYHPIESGAPGPPAAVQLDDGDLLIEFHGSRERRDFQILTPEAIASVRGTRWAVERTAGKTAILVLRGAVEVTRAGTNVGAPVVLRRGQGVDVSAGDAPLEVKRWSQERVKALLARFPR